LHLNGVKNSSKCCRTISKLHFASC